MEDHIRTTSEANDLICSRSDLAKLLNVDSRFIEKVVSHRERFYSEFSIPKSNGDLRTIRPPCRNLRQMQRILLNEFYRRTKLRSCLHGGLRGRSIVSHARAHVGREMVATLDIRSFFPSTTSDHLSQALIAIGFRGDALSDVVGLTMLDGQLPQGAPTSSLLANLAFAPGDTDFINLCRRKRLRYSRYVDDIAISGDYDFHHLRGEFVSLILKQGYAVSPEKIHFMPRHTRQVVTGLVVNQQLRPTRQFLQELNNEIRLCIEFGASLVAKIQGETVRQIKNRLSGRVSHVLHIDPALGRRLQGRLYGVDWRSMQIDSNQLSVK